MPGSAEGHVNDGRRTLKPRDLSVNVGSSRQLQLYWPLQRERRTGGHLAPAQHYNPHLRAGKARPTLASPDRSAALSFRACRRRRPREAKPEPATIARIMAPGPQFYCHVLGQREGGGNERLGAGACHGCRCRLRHSVSAVGPETPNTEKRPLGLLTAGTTSNSTQHRQRKDCKRREQPKQRENREKLSEVMKCLSGSQSDEFMARASCE